jgi:hypothetical protein
MRPIAFLAGYASGTAASHLGPFAAELAATDLRQVWWASARTTNGDVASAVATGPGGEVFVAGANQGGPQGGIRARKLDARGQQ